MLKGHNICVFVVLGCVQHSQTSTLVQVLYEYFDKNANEKVILMLVSLFFEQVLMQYTTSP